jgi:NAD(P)-dependent dehydrogenase (short-subunit alcohol dehydrogenase family)
LARTNTKHFHGKVALVSGGNQGIGLAIAHALAAEGCTLVIAGRNPSSLNEAAKGLVRYGIQVFS